MAEKIMGSIYLSVLKSRIDELLQIMMGLSVLRKVAGCLQDSIIP